DIIQKGRVVRGWLGVAIQDLTPELASHFKVKEGVLISQVFRGGPAEKAGMQRGDVVVEFDGKKVGKYRELQAMVAAKQAGKSVSVKVIRQGREKILNLKIGERGAGRELVVSAPETPGASAGDYLGITVADITADLASQYSITARQGVIVINVAEGSSADEAGVMKGDVIHEVNGTNVKNAQEFKEAVKGLRQGREAVLLIERGDAMVYLAFRVK
ncbi:MAG TPA: PDZ domain-containing protein, partial [Candidatus Goldiibacteriota bacterium]|nr:PDZ domain-containing protein [Candidatus Goldiibacteriota bacterium]